MCDPAPRSKAPYVLSAVAVGAGVAVAAGAKSAPKAAPAVRAVPVAAHAGFPWLTASLSVLVGAAVVGLVILLVRLRRRPAVVAQVPSQRAIEPRTARRELPSREPAQAWLDKAETR
jgi:hypothetical protein